MTLDIERLLREQQAFQEAHDAAAMTLFVLSIAIETGDPTMEKTETNGNPLIEFAVDSWNSQVKNRPLVNIHRPALDSVWRQVIKWAGGDPEALLGPSHRTQAGTGWTPALIREQGAVADLEEVRRAVFGDIGDEPDVYADYDRCSDLANKMREAIKVVEERYVDIL